MFRVLANGDFSDEQLKDLTEDEKRRLKELIQDDR
jgi:hypothetical protein